jgi:hypothetical protein
MDFKNSGYWEVGAGSRKNHKQKENNSFIFFSLTSKKKNVTIFEVGVHS